MESSINGNHLNCLEANCPNTSTEIDIQEVKHELSKSISESDVSLNVAVLNEEAAKDESDVKMNQDTTKELDKDNSACNPINADLETSEENIISNDNTQSSDSGFPNGSLEKMSIIDEETNEAIKASKTHCASLDSDDDSEPVVTELKVNTNEESAMDSKSDRICDMVVDDDDEDSGGGGTTSYETAGSSAASQCDKPSPFKGTKALENYSKHESSSSDIGTSNGARGRKRMNLRSRLSSSSSSSSSRTASSSASSSSSLDSDDDSKSSVNSSGTSVPSESWRKKNLFDQLRKANKGMSNQRESVPVEGREGITPNENAVESANKTRQNLGNEGPNEEIASSSSPPGRKKKKKKSKKRPKLEKRRKPSVSPSSNSSDAFVSLEDIPASSELQDPGFRVLNSSARDNESNKNDEEAQNRDSNDENLSDNVPSDNDDDIPNGTGRQRHRSSSSSSSSSSNSDAILRQARFGPRNRMMRARIRAQEDAAREGESDSERPPPDVLSKPSAKCKYSFFKDFIKRQYDNKPTHPWFIKNRIGSLDLVKRFELSKKLEGHEVSLMIFLSYLTQLMIFY